MSRCFVLIKSDSLGWTAITQAQWRGSSRTERLQRWAAAGGGAGQESSVPVLAQGQEELRPEATVDFVLQKLWDTGGEEMPVLVRWKAGARKSWGSCSECLSRGILQQQQWSR